MSELDHLITIFVLLFFLQYGRGSAGNKIYVSGPLLVSSNNVDQMLKEHDRRIQEHARRARFDKARVGNNHPQAAVDSKLVSVHDAG